MKAPLNVFRTCLLFRYRLARCVDRGETPHACEREHLSVCSRCRGFFERKKGLVDDLRREASRMSAAPDKMIRARICSSIADLPQPKSVRMPVTVSWPAAIGVGVIAAGLLVFVMLGSVGPGGEESAVAGGGEWAEAQQVLARFDDFEKEIYLQELDHLAADGQAAARFLLFPIPFDE